MFKKHWVLTATLLAFTMIVQGCKSTGSIEDDAGAVDGTGQDGATPYGVNDGNGVGSGPYAGMTKEQVMASTVFYFDYDQSTIRYESRAALNAHAEYLRQNVATTVVLEGHADERGTREYNLALGEQRANAIRSYLQARGVSASKAESVSYGEEKPIAFGNNESSWGQNRRVELKYIAR